ncbi:MAG: hypothetical protein RL497_1364 [Pseudomonadota bacterium]
MKRLRPLSIFSIALALAGCNAQTAPESTPTVTPTPPVVAPTRQKLSALTFDSLWIKACIADAQFQTKIQYVDELTKLSCDGYPKGFDSFILDQSGGDMIVTSTRGLEQLTALTELDLSDNYIAEIDLSSLTKLTKLNLSGNLVQTLDLSRYTHLQTLIITDNPLYRLILPQNSQLETLQFGKGYGFFMGIETLKSYVNGQKEAPTDKRFFDEQSGTLLTDEHFKRLDNLDFSQQKALKSLTATSAALKSLALDTFPVNNALSHLNLAANALTSVNLSRLNKLLSLNLQSNNIASLDLTAQPELAELNFSYNKPTPATLTAIKNNKLKSIDLTASHISDSDLQVLFSSNTLETVQMANTDTNFTPVSLAPNLSTLTVSGHYSDRDFAAATHLNQLTLNGGSIKGLDFSAIPYLNKLYFIGTQIESSAALNCARAIATVEIHYPNDEIRLGAVKPCGIGSLRLSSDKVLNKVDLSGLHTDAVTLVTKGTSYKNIVLNGNTQKIDLDGISDLDRFSFYDVSGLQSLRFANTSIKTFGLKGAGQYLTSFSLENVDLNQLELSGNNAPLSTLNFEFVRLTKLNLSPVVETLTQLRLFATSITQLDMPKLNPSTSLDIYSLKLDTKSLANFEKVTGRKLDSNGTLVPKS